MKFRKKPVVIEAVRFQQEANRAFQWTGGPDQLEDPEWICDAIRAGTAGVDPNGKTFWIKTLEGKMRASVGDWIIKGVKGEIYPCKPDIFEATYDEVQDD